MGRLVMVGVSHHAAPLEVRERIALDEATWRSVAPSSLGVRPGTVLLSTCNRVEVYAWVDGRPAATLRALQRSLARAAGMDSAELLPYLTSRSGTDALLHLVRVTSSLDSLVVGEEQIRGQVRQALRAAEAAGTLPSSLRGVFQRVGESARRVRGGTSLGKAPSIASAGVAVACRAVGDDVTGRLAVVLGAGIMARAATEALLAHGMAVRMLNRTPEHASRVMRSLGQSVEISSLEGLPSLMTEAALIVGATASREPVLTTATVEGARGKRGGQPLVLLDVALPRDIESTVRHMPGVMLIDLDDLERLCPVDADSRNAERQRAEALAAEEANRLAEWLRTRAVSPAITELRTYAESIRRTEVRRAASRLRDLTPDQIAAVEALTSGIVNKLMHGPTVALRDAATRPGGLGRSRSSILRVLRPNRGRSV
jgi:glutamyl-tRNA reductase